MTSAGDEYGAQDGGPGGVGRAESAAARERRFFLPAGPEDPHLTPEDERHALRVLRVRAGDELRGFDGRGGSWRLLVRETGRASLELELVPDSERRDPAPGEPGALPRLEVASAIPKGSRLEDSWARMVALGVSAWQPLVCARSGPAAREFGAKRRERLERIAIEVCKQSGRAWLPEVGELATPASWLATESPEPTARAVASPQAERDLAGWARQACQTTGVVLKVAVGPEGGFDSAEQLALDSHADSVVLGPHVLRIEVAAEAICAIVAQASFHSG